MAQFTGTVIVKLNGAKIWTKPGAKLELSGSERQAVMGDGVTAGYFNTPRPAKVTATILHNAETDLEAIEAMTDVTVTFECDSGPVYALPNAWSSVPPDITGDGEGCAIEFMSARSKKIR